MFTSWVLARLSEPSTWLGISLLAQNLSTVASQVASHNYTGLVEIGAGLLGVVMKEGK